MKRIGLIFALILALLLTMLPMTAMAAVGDGAEFEDGDISVPVGPGGNVPVPSTYTVIFKDRNGATLSSEKYEYGAALTFPQVQDPIVDVYGTHTFAGWRDSNDKPAPDTCIGAATYTATYETVWNEYTVTFKNEDGSTLATGTYHYGDAVNAPADPTKADDDTYTYTFAGWDKTVTEVTGDAVYTATYTKTEKNPIDTSKNGWRKENGKWYYYQAGITQKNVWKKDSTGWCYLGADGAMMTEAFVKDSTGWCWVDASGYMVYNRWVKSEGKWYYVDANGYRVHNAWKKDSRGWCYVGADGAMLTNAFAKDSSGWCWVDGSGYIVYSQWVTDNGNKYYINAAGYRVTGEHTIDGESYYFDANGVMQVRYTVTFKNADGTVLSSKKYAEGATVEVPADPTKAPDANYTYTFAGWDKEIVPVTGDATYTATYTKTERPAGSQHGWVKEDGKWYYYEQGVMVTNKWKKDSKGWCYLGANGAMVTNRWIKDSVGWCYVGSDGYCLTNSWVKDSTGWCYLDANGRMVYNRWVGSGSTWYYIDGNGYMLASTSKVISGKRYYFNASGLCTNP